MNIKPLSYYQTNTEWQVFDRKSVRIACKDFAELIVAFANADGGEVVIGIEDDGAITGVDHRMEHLNDLLRVPFDYCIPSAQSESKMIDCIDKDGNPNHVVVMQVQPSLKVYTNQADEVFYRVGDHMTVESPGILPGLVRTDNIRTMHFSRNPKIAQYMRAFKLVKEFGEGVDCMFREMQEAGSPEPVFEQVGFMVKASIYQHRTQENVQEQQTTSQEDGWVMIAKRLGDKAKRLGDKLGDTKIKILYLVHDNPKISIPQMANSLEISTAAVEKHLSTMRDRYIRHIGTAKNGSWEILSE